MAFALLAAYVAAAMAFSAAFGGSAFLALVAFTVSAVYSWLNHAKKDVTPTLLLILGTIVCLGVLLFFLLAERTGPEIWTLPVAGWLGMFWSWRRITAKP